MENVLPNPERAEPCLVRHDYQAVILAGAHAITFATRHFTCFKVVTLICDMYDIHGSAAERVQGE
jgi:hypothetical protein